MIVGIRNKCSTEMSMNNNDNNNKERKKAIRNTMTELISNYKKMEIIIMKRYVNK